MDQNELALRTLLIAISNKLSTEDHKKLGFLLVDDVPRRDIDAATNGSHASMNGIWDTLINRQKIAPGNVEYLIIRFEKIGRMDIVRQLRQYLTTANPENQLFNRIDP